jgi:hypothetical protein
MQTYEEANYGGVYGGSMALAGWNQLLPDRPSFGLPTLEGVQPYPYIPPVLLKAIAWLESGWAQADYSVPYGAAGPTLISHDCGYGIMQVTSGMQNVSGVPNLDQAMIGGHYAFNIARGARILADKWNLAPEFRPFVGSRNSQIIEDWYYALWGYNGFAFKNHPLNPAYNPQRAPYRCDGSQPRSDYPYQELVLGCVATPPQRGGVLLWNPQPVTLPNLADPAFAGPLRLENWAPCSQSLQCWPMNMPTPNGWHVDPTVPAMPREQTIGVPVLSLSTGSISLASVPGGESRPSAAAISNSGTGVLAWRATSSASWLKLSRSQGVSFGGISQELLAYADASGLPPGTYTSAISVESLYSAGAPATISVTLFVGFEAVQIEAGDFTRDGRSDLAFLCCSDYASVWLANSSGVFDTRTFTPWPSYNTRAGSWKGGDFNGDGRADLVHLCCEDYVHIWLSNGDGTFSVSTFRPWPGYAIQVGSWQVGDFSGDGKTDLLHFSPLGYVHQWSSNGAGGFNVSTFEAWPGYGVSSGSWKKGDLNADGKTDLVHLTGNDYVHTWFARGDGSFAVGTFRPWAGYNTGSGSWLEVDLNGDGRTDLIHVSTHDYVHPWLSNGDGSFGISTFRPWAGYEAGVGSWEVGDFNGDGSGDLVHLTSGKHVHTWLSNGNAGFSIGTFQPWADYRVQRGEWRSGDFNGDGLTDLMHLCCDYVHVWYSLGSGNYAVGIFKP